MRISMRLKADFGRLKQLPREIDEINERVTHRLALEAANDMKHKAPKTSSITANSIQITKKGNAFYVVGPTVKHGLFVEHGRSPGRRPPKQAILDWMKAKGIRLPTKKANQVAFLIARKIGRKGTKPQPFVSPVARDRKWREKYYRLIQRDIDRFLA